MNTRFEYAYSNLVLETLKQPLRETRNARTYSHFGQVITFNDLEHGELPILTGRKYFPKGVIGEFAAFLKGPQTVKDFEDQGCNYWKQWADEDGSIHVDYGNAWIDFNGVNQLECLANSIKEDPNGRRHVVTGWRPDRLPMLSLPCCHYAYQFYVRDDTYLDMLWHQRSCDVMVGLPADALLAALWTIVLANETGYKPGRITMTLGDTHIYECHHEGALTYLNQYGQVPGMRKRGPLYTLHPRAGFNNFRPDMVTIGSWYESPAIKFELLS